MVTIVVGVVDDLRGLVGPPLCLEDQIGIRGRGDPAEVMGLGRRLIIFSVAFAGDDKVVGHRVSVASVATGIVVRPSDLLLDLGNERETSDLRCPVFGVIGSDKAIEVGGSVIDMTVSSSPLPVQGRNDGKMRSREGMELRI